MIDRIRDRSRVILWLVLGFVIGTSIVSQVLLTSPPHIRTDTAFFQHAGWYINQGAVPYVDIWDVKPPLAFVIQALYASLTGDNMYLLHLVNVMFTSLAVLGTVLFTAQLIREITGDRLAGMAGGLVLLSIPYLYMYAAMGFRSKIYVICFGVLSLLCQLKNRPFWSGMFAVVSASFWQFGIIFPLLSLFIPCRENNLQALRRTVIGVLLAGLLVLLPIIYWGAMEAMIVEVIIAPLMVGEPWHFLYRITQLILWSNIGILTMVFGLAGCLIFVVKGPDKHRWWLGIGLVFSLVQVLLIDLDSHQDSFILLLFISIGAGYLVHWLEPRHVTYVIVIIGVSVLLNWALHLDGFGPERIALPEIQSTWLSAFQKPDPPDDTVGDHYPGQWRNRDFWNRRIPEQCHYRFSSVEKGWLELTNQPPTAGQCGRLKHLGRITSENSNLNVF